jgi:hypothetical protein
VANCFSLAARFPLPEVLHCEYRLHTLNEIFGAQETHAGFSPRDGDDRHQASAGQNKRPEPVPVTRLANRSGNSFVEGMQNGIERGNVRWADRGRRHMPLLYQTGLVHGGISVRDCYRTFAFRFAPDPRSSVLIRGKVLPFRLRLLAW